MRRLLATAAVAAICVLGNAGPVAADPPADDPTPGPPVQGIPTCVGCW